jgi:hypothetical protein
VAETKVTQPKCSNGDNIFWVKNIIELLPARSKLLQRVEHRRAAKGQIPAR